MAGSGAGAFTAAEKASSLFEHERVGAFADAILAIFATVAAVPLAKVEVEPPEDGSTLSAWDVLVAKAPNILLYMITFGIVGAAFVDSMRLTHRARVMRRRAMVPFVFFLLSTSLIPLGFILTQSSNSSQPDPLAITAYFSLMILSKLASLVLRCVLRPVLRVEYPMQDAVEACTAVVYMLGCVALIGVGWILSALHTTASLVWYATPCLGAVARLGPSFMACCCRQEVTEAKAHIRTHGRWLLDRERMAAFTDGVLAISATFTLLEIRAPTSSVGAVGRTAAPLHASEGGGGETSGGFATYIQHHWRDLLSYAASFSVILQLWVTHREVTSAVPRFGKTLRGLNLLSCMLAALIPFSMSLVVTFPDDPTASVFALVVVVVASGAMAMLPLLGRWWMLDLQGIPLLSLELFEEEEEEGGEEGKEDNTEEEETRAWAASRRTPGDITRGRSAGEDSYYGFLVEDDPGADSKTDGRDMARAARQLRAAAVRPGSVLPEGSAAAEEDDDDNEEAEAGEEDGDDDEARFNGTALGQGDAHGFSVGGSSTVGTSPRRNGGRKARSVAGRAEAARTGGFATPGGGGGGGGDGGGGVGALGEVLLVRHGRGGYHPKTLPAALEEHLVRLLVARALVLPAVALLVIPVAVVIPGIGLLLLPLVWVVVGAIGWAGSLLVVAALAALRPWGGNASNFAQLSGTERQRTASTTRTGWTARYGAAVTVKENPRVADGVELPERERSRLYLLGGDDYLHSPGSGGYRNDVWYTTGESNIAVNSVVEKNQFGAALPRIVSTTSWVESLDQTPPQGIGYKEWLCCLPEVSWECDFVSCSPIDPFQGQRRWSPRRDHAAVTVKNTKLFVMGGRARALEDIPAAEAIGGIIPPRGRWRERSILMGDVWMSTDGEDWSLVTPGCYVHQPGIVPGNGLPVQQCRSTLECWSKKLGPTRCNNGVCECTMWSPREQFAAAAVDSELFVMGGRTYMPLQACGAFRCGTEYTRFLDDVWRSSDDGRTWEQLKPLGGGQWAPRAGFGLAVAGGYFWLAAGRGGATTDYSSNPLFNDVWRSPDGVSWTQNVSSAPWLPRTNAQLVGSGQSLLLIGGSVEVPPHPSPSPLPAAGQAAAAAAVAPVHRILGVDPSPSPLPTLEGETVSGIRLLPVDEVWTFDIGSTTATNEWLRDYRPGTPQAGYVGLNTTVSQAFNLSSTESLAMQAAGMPTVYTLSTASARAVRKLRLGQTTPAWPNRDGSTREACFFVKWAQAITDVCETLRRPYDGEFAIGVTIIEGSVAAAALRSGATVDSLVSEATQRTTLERLETDEELGGLTGCDDRVGEITVDPQDADVVCKELPAARESHSAAEMDGRVYVMAGYERRSTSAADAWYRDPVLPGTVITQAPRSSTSETIFEFAASEEACIFEWRIFELPGLVKATVPGTGVELRNWTRQLPPVDIVDFIYAGFFRVEVRAVDPAGNRDQTSLPGINVYAWEYVPPIPWGWIILGIILGLLFLIFGLYYYRRYRRRKAMERYAQQRIKRKIKAVAEGDWRNAYQGGKKKKKRKGKSKKRTERERRAKESGKDGKRKRKGADDDKKKSKKKKKKKASKEKKSKKSKKSKKL